MIIVLTGSFIVSAQAPGTRNFQSGGFGQKRDERVYAAQKEISAPAVGELDPTLNAVIDTYPGYIRSSAVQADGKILLGGDFNRVNGNSRRGLVRLNADKSFDSSFNAVVNGIVYAITVQTDGKILIGGSFTAVNGTTQNRIARLNSDGSLDAAFNQGDGADNTVYDIAVQPDGKIVIGGSFAVVGPALGFYVARLNANGSRDSTFVSPIPPPGSSAAVPSIVYSIAIQTDGKILLGGYIILDYFSSPNISNPIVRLNEGGSVDSSFNTGGINSNLQKLALQPDGKILIAGFFTNIGGVTRRFLARLNTDGSLDAAFNQGDGISAPVFTVGVRSSSGKIVIGGLFSSINGTVRRALAQLNADGTLDTAFDPGVSIIGSVYTTASLPNNQIIAGGTFFRISGLENDTAAVFNENGSLDATFNFTTTARGGVRAILPQSNGKIIVGGTFNRIDGVSKSRLARLNADGSIDETFNTASFFVSDLAVILEQPDGKILLGGSFVSGSGTVRASFSVARINADGSLDSSFTQGNLFAPRTVKAMALQADGKILVSYTSATFGGAASGTVSRLNGDGSLDSTFSAPAFPYEAIAIQTDGKILVGGEIGLGYVNSGTGRNDYYGGVLRLNADGSHDKTFRAPYPSGLEHFTKVYALTVQPDGKVLVGGNIFVNQIPAPVAITRLKNDGTLDETFQLKSIRAATGFARVEDIQLLPNGKIIIGGLFTNLGADTRNNIARINSDGSLDNTFNSSADDAVFDVALQFNGRVLIAGDFETVNNAARTSLARLLNEPIVAGKTLFDYDGDGKADISVWRPSNGVWYLLGSNSPYTGVQFGISTDKTAPADYDGDGKTDIAVYRDGNWFIQRSATGFLSINFGSPGDVPAPADFDGDGKADLAVFRPSNGVWYVLNLTNNAFSAVQFGQTSDVPVAADYDGDGKSDYAVWRPSNGVWYLLRSRDGFLGIQFGISTDKPTVGDYDGDGKADVAVYRVDSGTWFQMRSTEGFTSTQFGAPGDVPAPADFDGDGRTDITVFRPSNGVWYQQKSRDGFGAIQFGANGDIPTPSAYVP